MPDPEAVAAIEALFTEIAKHEPHQWNQVGPCVYCADCNVRLYQGSLPAERNPDAKVCEKQGHDWDDADSMSQSGFYYLCLRCGAQEWTE